MNTTLLTLGLAVAAVFGLVVGLGILSLLSGAMGSLFNPTGITILRSKRGKTGFAFSFKWDSASDPASINRVRVRLYNPHGSPTQVDLSNEFTPQSKNFSQDVDLGPGFLDLLSAEGLDKAQVQVEMASKDDVVTFSKMFKARNFIRDMEEATEMAAGSDIVSKGKVYYHTPKRSFIADPIATANKALKIASNPQFAGQLAPQGAGEGAAAAEENFAVSKVWIDPGCIVCDACETIFPEVFDVKDDTCIIRPDAPLTDGLKIEEAAEACPVEVIKFNK